MENLYLYVGIDVFVKYKRPHEDCKYVYLG